LVILSPIIKGFSLDLNIFTKYQGTIILNIFKFKLNPLIIGLE
jgi:hypothetical protein